MMILKCNPRGNGLLVEWMFSKTHASLLLPKSIGHLSLQGQLSPPTVQRIMEYCPFKYDYNIHFISISEAEANGGKEDSNTESRPTPSKRSDIAQQMLEDQKKNEFLAMIYFNLAELVSLKRKEVQILSEKHLNKTFFLNLKTVNT
ncbi:hypothetical protein MAR_014228 [Mya arenaria]|uniref:Uncharacterized protein n=1 Tax=Mya arenaria TaxID=6604 RepID=A0ABY7G583_MYAAR|nr:hypothetical protein MAR_014228 [Mya arenaria]